MLDQTLGRCPTAKMSRRCKRKSRRSRRDARPACQLQADRGLNCTAFGDTVPRCSHRGTPDPRRSTPKAGQGSEATRTRRPTRMGLRRRGMNLSEHARQTRLQSGGGPPCNGVACSTTFRDTVPKQNWGHPQARQPVPQVRGGCYPTSNRIQACLDVQPWVWVLVSCRGSSWADSF